MGFTRALVPMLILCGAAEKLMAAISCGVGEKVLKGDPSICDWQVRPFDTARYQHDA
jgi:hypothetical protein